jgi:hypothetical protein
MTTIAVPRSVAEALSKAKLPVRLVDEQGILLGSFSPVPPSSDELTPEELSEIKRRMNAPGPRYTTEQVLNHLSSLEKK